jgi:hypothetical protein
MMHIPRIAIGAALGFCVLHYAAGESRAATVKLCDQNVEYAIASPAADLSPALRALSGVWVGNVMFSQDAEMCVGMVIEAVESNGTVRTKFAWFAGSSTGMGNLASLGTTSWSGRVENGVLHLVGTQNGSTYTYDFQPTGANELRGYFAQNNHRTRLLLKRR